MTDPDLSTALMTWDQTPGDNRQRMEAVLAAVGLNRAHRMASPSGNLLDALVEAGINASVRWHDAGQRTRMIKIIEAVDDTRNSWRAHEAKMRDWPPPDCRMPNGALDCKVTARCVCIAGVCAHAGEER